MRIVMNYFGNNRLLKIILRNVSVYEIRVFSVFPRAHCYIAVNFEVFTAQTEFVVFWVAVPPYYLRIDYNRLVRHRLIFHTGIIPPFLFEVYITSAVTMLQR
jgi:hypothetical protein